MVPKSQNFLIKKEMNYLYKLLIILIVFTVFSHKISAEIKIPYEADENPRVLFDDSIDLGHYGLENYTADYVNGYLHISYTYSHGPSTAGEYAPLLYITRSDPRATLLPEVIKKLAIFSLPAFGGGLGVPTDWYTYDIQFLPNRFVEIIIKEKGTISAYIIPSQINEMEETDWVALANEYPISGTDHSMAFAPMPIKKIEVATRTPVIIIPGIMESYLNKVDGTEVWVNLPKMTFSTDDKYLDDLKLESNISISPSTVIEKINSYDFFLGLKKCFSK